MKVLPECSKKVVIPNVEQITIEPKPQPAKLSHNSLVCILFASLTVGILWQIHGMGLQYLMGGPYIAKIETNVERIHEDIPALTFCTNVGDITHGKTSNELFDGIKVTDIVDYIKVTSDYDGPPQNYTFMIENAIETISYKYYCFTINSALGGYQFEINKNQQIWIKLKSFGIYDSWWIAMHNSYDVPSSYEWNAIEVKKGYYVPITYDIETYEQSEYTLPSNCLNYNKHSQYTARRECIRKCKLSSSLDKCGVVYNGIDIKKGSEYVRFVGSKAEQKCVTNSIEFGDDCMRKCHNSDCRQDWYTPKIIIKSHNYNNYTLVELISPSKPHFAYKQKLQVNTNQAFYLMVGNISLWLGFALHFLFNWFSKCSVPKNMGQVYNKLAQSKCKTNEESKLPK